MRSTRPNLSANRHHVPLRRSALRLHRYHQRRVASRTTIVGGYMYTYIFVCRYVYLYIYIYIYVGTHERMDITQDVQTETQTPACGHTRPTPYAILTRRIYFAINRISFRLPEGNRLQFENEKVFYFQSSWKARLSFKNGCDFDSNVIALIFERLS